ncbi:hypothetical protein [Thiohalorhabdus methylotrophus]|uniref:Flagellar protein FliT n=1 Tax=Thiohalorhabdus methylotrophus TaxID=3242694 RepID=A0ABV4TVY2_9GAMM
MWPAEMTRDRSADALSALEAALDAARDQGERVRACLDAPPEDQAPLEESAFVYVELVGSALEELEGIDAMASSPQASRKAALKAAMDDLVAQYEELEARIRATYQELGERLAHLQRGGRTLKAYSGAAGQAGSYFVDRHG